MENSNNKTSATSPSKCQRWPDETPERIEEALRLLKRNKEQGKIRLANDIFATCETCEDIITELRELLLKVDDINGWLERFTSVQMQDIFDRLRFLVEDFEERFFDGETLYDFEVSQNGHNVRQRALILFEALHQKKQHELIQILRHEIIDQAYVIAESFPKN